VVILEEDDDVERSGPREEWEKRTRLCFHWTKYHLFLIKRVWEGKKNEEVGCVELQSETFALNRDSFIRN